MAADIYLEVEDYLWFDEYQQGNVNIAGLVFDDLIEETFDMGHEVYTVWTDQIEETIDLSEDFTPRHYATVNEIVSCSELFGTPTRVRQSVLNVIMTPPVIPINISHIHMDVLHGTDVYREEVSSELQIHSSYANAVPYWWEWIYESLDIDMTEPQPEPPITVSLKLLTSDLVNMRHDVVQEYLFNSKCFEEFFVWDAGVWGWGKLIDDSIAGADAIQEIIGKLADDYLLLGDTLIPQVAVLHRIDDYVFIFDEAEHGRYFLCQADETIAITDGEVSYVAVTTVGAIEEVLGIAADTSSKATFGALATESLLFADIPTFTQDLIIEEGIAFGDVELTRWVFNVLIESGCDIADIIS